MMIKISDLIEQNPRIVRIVFERDDEYHALLGHNNWWEAVGFRVDENPTFANRVKRLSRYGIKITLPRKKGLEFLRLCESIRGWDEGPHYAKRALWLDVIYDTGDHDAIDSLIDKATTKQNDVIVVSVGGLVVGVFAANTPRKKITAYGKKWAKRLIGGKNINITTWNVQ